jgi:2,3,4,5-tetrahydropyridine-2,6-dicarboxylate N-succinyltransferase
MTHAPQAAGSAGDAVGSPLPADIDEFWDRRASLTPADAVARDLVYLAVDMIDAGQARVAWIDPESDQVVVDERAKRAILLAFRLMPMVASETGGFR